jgi:hypothetical protein
VKKAHPMLIDDSFKTAKLNFESPDESLMSSTDQQMDVEMHQESAEPSRTLKGDQEMYDEGIDSWQEHIQSTQLAEAYQPEPFP